MKTTTPWKWSFQDDQLSSGHREKRAECSAGFQIDRVETGCVRRNDYNKALKDGYRSLIQLDGVGEAGDPAL